MLLGSAGNDTTKQASSHALAALAAHPTQRAWLLADFDERIDGAIEEFVRWATPVMHFARHATVDTEVAGTPVAAGEKLVLFYCSANRDAAVFDHPHAFDLSRSPIRMWGSAVPARTSAWAGNSRKWNCGICSGNC